MKVAEDLDKGFEAGGGHGKEQAGVGARKFTGGQYFLLFKVCEDFSGGGIHPGNYLEGPGAEYGGAEEAVHVEVHTAVYQVHREEVGQEWGIGVDSVEMAGDDGDNGDDGGSGDSTDGTSDNNGGSSDFGLLIFGAVIVIIAIIGVIVIIAIIRR